MARFKVVLTDTTVPDYDVEEGLFRERAPDIDRVYLHTHRPDDVTRSAADADAIIVSWAPITRAVIAQLSRCRVISRYGIGVDMIDLDAATEHGIVVCNTARYCIDEVSTHAITLLLALNRHLLADVERVRAGGWSASDATPPRRLRGQQLGIIGFGNIGRAVGRKAIGLGMRVVAHDPYVSASDAPMHGNPDAHANPVDRPHDDLAGIPLIDLDDLLRSSDVVSVHVPLNPSTRHLIGRRELALLSSHALLINTARGGLIDQAALTDVLANRRIAGAGIDVVEPEPLPPDDPLRRMENVILTPHSAHWSSESTVECRTTAVEHVLTVLRGGIPSDVVNRTVLERSNRRV